MKPTHPIELLACAIASQEGWFSPGTTPVLRNNPGDIRFSGQMNAFTPGWDGKPPAPIANFKSPEMGIVGLFRQLWLQVAQGQTVRGIIAQWAPPNENDTSKYLENVLLWTGLPADVPVVNLIPKLIDLRKS